MTDAPDKAREIAQRWNPSVIDEDNVRELAKDIGAALKAERKAGELQWHKAGYEDGYRRGIEEAAKVVENQGLNEEPELMRETLAERIRGLDKGADKT